MNAQACAEELSGWDDARDLRYRPDPVGAVVGVAGGHVVLDLHLVRVGGSVVVPAEGRCVLDLVGHPLVTARPPEALAAVHRAAARAQGARPVGAEVLEDAAGAVPTGTRLVARVGRVGVGGSLGDLMECVRACVQAHVS